MSNTTTELPTARVGRRAPSLAWSLPFLALVLVAVLLRAQWQERGPLVTVRAREGHGLRVGDALVHRGIRVGELVRVELTPGLREVELDVRLGRAAAGLARAGSRFWIVHPRISLEGVSGLETIAGPRYLAVSPGPSGATRQSFFVAVEEPPGDEDLVEAGLELVLEAPSRHGLVPGAPLSYRGVRVGTLTSVELASDGTCVEAHAYVRPTYAALVREGTRFFVSGGFQFEAGLRSGVRLSVDSLSSLVSGGVALATPDEPGAPARDGARFELAAEPDAEWLLWRPALALGEAPAGPGVTRPRPLRARLSWTEGRLFADEEERLGWVLSVEEGVLGPRDLLDVPPAAREGSARLEVEGTSFAVAGEARRSGGRLGLRSLGDAGLGAPWPTTRVRVLLAPEDLLVLGDPALEPLAVSAARLAAEERGRWRIEDPPTSPEEWHGAAAVSRLDGALVGIVRRDGDALLVVPWRP